MTARSPSRPPEKIWIHRDGLAFVVCVLDAPVSPDRFDDRRKAIAFAEMLAKATGSEIIDASEGLVQ
ncbi:hypothetical protein GCM10023208_24560 [Erythrobacter westpacificensis]|uniref:DUF1488 domain-containing protein n=1 Tax=Erythrobacter westpacificensis TaxID=1055231 RepID=A0ABP9KJ01_9SPHN